MSQQESEFRYPKNTRFTCSRCALCCGDTETRIRHILLFEKEVEEISKVASKPLEAFVLKTLGREPYLYEMMKNKEGKCVFLKGKDCSVYSSRPLICRYYPFELVSGKDAICLFYPTKECPGVGVGEVLKKPYFSNLFETARKVFSEAAPNFRRSDPGLGNV